MDKLIIFHQLFLCNNKHQRLHSDHNATSTHLSIANVQPMSCNKDAKLYKWRSFMMYHVTGCDSIKYVLMMLTYSSIQIAAITNVVLLSHIPEHIIVTVSTPNDKNNT